MFAERMGTLFLEASAKTAVGVRQTFVDLLEKVNRGVYANAVASYCIDFTPFR